MTKKQKQEKRKRKRVFFSIIMILVTGAMLSTATYAWFTANKDVDIEAIDVNVSASTGLQISAYPTSDSDWKTYVSYSEFKAVATNQFPDTISPVSTIGKVASTSSEGTVGRMLMYKGSLDSYLDSSHKDVYTLTTAASGETNGTSGAYTGGDFIAFDLYVRAGLDGTIYLKKPSAITINNDPTATDAGNGIENATRVAFVMEGYTASSAATASTVSSYNCASNNDIASDGSTITGTTTEATASRCYANTIWEPNDTTHNANGIANAENIYGWEATDLTSKLSYLGVKSEISTAFPIKSTKGVPDDASYTSYFGSTAVTTVGTTSTGIDETARVPAFKVKTGVNKIRIYVWIEGQDVDCEDKASNSTINVDLAFSIESHA